MKELNHKSLIKLEKERIDRIEKKNYYNQENRSQLKIGGLANLKLKNKRHINNSNIPTVQKYADLLKNDEHCDLVIALTHIGYTEHNPGDVTDPVLCSKTRNIDLFVGGHSHTFLSEMAYHPNVDGVPVPIVQSGEQGVYFGQIDYRP